MRLYQTAAKGNNKVIRPTSGLPDSLDVNSTDIVPDCRYHLKTTESRSDVTIAASGANNSANRSLLKTDNSINESNLKTNLAAACYLAAIYTVGFTNTAYADWFQVANIKANLITPVYTLISGNLGFIAFAVGGAATFLARGQDMWQKSLAFGVGSLGTAGSVKLAETVLHLS